jgi:hypothetical protein
MGGFALFLKISEREGIANHLQCLVLPTIALPSPFLWHRSTPNCSTWNIPFGVVYMCTHWGAVAYGGKVVFCLFSRIR